jgi:hypothetical protein
MMTIYASVCRWANEKEMEDDPIMKDLIALLDDGNHKQHNSEAFTEIRRTIDNLKAMFRRKAKGNYKACPHPCPGNDLIAHDPSHGGCARMQTMHEDWVFFATNQTANMHCNIHPDDDGDDAFDNRRDEEDVTNNPLLGFTGIRIVTYSLKAIDKGLVLARLEEERMRTKKKEAREAEEEEQDGKKGNGFVWTLLKKLLMVRARTSIGREASHSRANPPVNDSSAVRQEALQ